MQLQVLEMLESLPLQCREQCTLFHSYDTSGSYWRISMKTVIIEKKTQLKGLLAIAVDL